MSKLKNKRFFLCKDTASSVHLRVPNKKDYQDCYDVMMRDCSRQIHWQFFPTKAGLAKAKKVRDLFNQLYEDLAASLEKKDA